ncbi:hypothetical protein [Bacteroides clarus]
MTPLQCSQIAWGFFTQPLIQLYVQIVVYAKQYVPSMSITIQVLIYLNLKPMQPAIKT